MKRRSYLGFLGTGTVGALSGCIGPLDDITSGENGESDNGENDDIRDIDVPIDDRTFENQHSINVPSRDDWNGDYLGENLERHNDLDYEEIDVFGIEHGNLDLMSSRHNNEFSATLIDSEARESELFSDSLGVNYRDNYVLVVESGYVSDNLRHEWVGMERIGDNSYRLFGYYQIPPTRDGSVSKISSVFTVPAESNEYTVTLVVNQDTSVNFSTDEGVVGFDRV